MAAAETNGLMLSKPWFTSTPGQADLASPDNGVSVDDVLEVIPELVEERARARVEVPGQKKGLVVGDLLGIFDGPVHVGIVERVPHLFDREERAENAVVGDDKAVELIQRPAALPEDAPREVPGAEVE